MAGNHDNKRRDFLQLSTITIGAVGTAAFIWPFLKSMNPAEDTIALGTTEVDVSQISTEEWEKWNTSENSFLDSNYISDTSDPLLNTE